jgi:hypothetical protein
MKIKMSVSEVTGMLLLIPRRTASILSTVSPHSWNIILRSSRVRRAAIHVLKTGPGTIKSSRVTVSIGKTSKRGIKIHVVLHGGIARVIRKIVILVPLTHPRHGVALHLRLPLHKSRRIITSIVTVPHQVLIVEISTIRICRIGIIRVHVVIWDAHGLRRREFVIGEVLLSLG